MHNYKIILVKETEGEEDNGFPMRLTRGDEKLFTAEIEPEEMIEILQHAFDLVARRKSINK